MPTMAANEGTISPRSICPTYLRPTPPIPATRSCESCWRARISRIAAASARSSASMVGGTAGTLVWFPVAFHPLERSKCVVQGVFSPVEGVREAPPGSTSARRRGSRLTSPLPPAGSARQRPGSRAGALACSDGRVLCAGRLVVELPLQLAEDRAEQQVSPGRLRKGTAVAGQARQVRARRVEAVAQPS